MEITQEQYQLIADVFPKHRGTVKISNRRALNGILYILEHGCKWRALPERFANLAHHLHADEPLGSQRSTGPGVPTPTTTTTHRPQVLGLDSTSVKAHPDATGALKTRGPQAIGRSRGGMNTKIHMVAADARTAIIYALSPGQDHDAPHGRELLKKMGPPKKEKKGEQLQLFLVADRAYEGDETRQLALALGYTPVIPPKSNRRHPWEYNRQIYKRRNEVERLFRRLKGYRRVFTRYDKPKRDLPSIHHPRPHPRHTQKREHALGKTRVS